MVRHPICEVIRLSYVQNLMASGCVAIRKGIYSRRVVKCLIHVVNTKIVTVFLSFNIEGGYSVHSSMVRLIEGKKYLTLTYQTLEFLRFTCNGFPSQGTSATAFPSRNAVFF